MNEPRGVWAKPAEKGTGQGGAGSAMCGGEKKKRAKQLVALFLIGLAFLKITSKV